MGMEATWPSHQAGSSASAATLGSTIAHLAKLRIRPTAPAVAFVVALLATGVGLAHAFMRGVGYILPCPRLMVWRITGAVTLSEI